MSLLTARAVLALAVLLLVTALAAACGGSDGSEPGNTGTSLRSPEAAGSSRSNGGTQAFTVERMMELAGSEVEGYVAGEPVPGAANSNVTVTYEPEDGGKGLTALVTLAPCDPFLCWDLDGQISREQERNLKSVLPRIHMDNPDLVFEYGAREVVPGYEAFFTYSRSFIQDGNTTASTNSYRLLYHDSANLISIMITPAGPMPESELELEMELDQSKGELTARTFFAAFADAFQPTN